MIQILLLLVAFVILTSMFVMIVNWVRETDWYFYKGDRGRALIMLVCGVLYGSFSQGFWMIALANI